MSPSGHRARRLNSWCSASPLRLCVALSIVLAAIVLPANRGKDHLQAQEPPVLPPLEATEVAANKVPLDAPRDRYALIVVGIPGDEVRSTRFRRIVATLQEWLVSFADVKPQNTFVLTPESDSPSDTETLRSVTADLSRKLRADDALWVFSIGHGSVDKRSAWFHLPGPDLNDAQWADLFAEVQAKEQVYWFTHSGSGRFVKSLSRPGRVVVAATDSEEVNETRFPVILADIMSEQLAGLDQADQADSASETEPPASPDQPTARPAQPTEVSVLSLFKAVCEGVDAQFQSENLVPTEHGQLDDNGDAKGTEAPDVSAEIESIDGGLANRIVIPLQPSAENKPDPGDTSNPDLIEERTAP